MKQKAVVPAGPAWKAGKIEEFPGSPFKRIGKDWMLIAAGDVKADKSAWNAMTASWGMLGVLWGKNAAQMYIRSTRHTLAFVDKNDLFCLSFFEEKYRKALTLFGEKSGRDCDKAAEANLTPELLESGGITFAEAKEALVCKKLYTHDFDPSRFLDPKTDPDIYPQKDYHRLFIGEIIAYWKK
jgi:flavin reductase (DIM6/NTAB) family NADH-FMN oxidoreductase RutF